MKKDNTILCDSDLGQPKSTVKIVGWLRTNLFSSLLNTFVTIAILYIFYLTVSSILDWLILNANFYGDSKIDCTKDGACWAFIRVHLSRFIYGNYPETERWRVNIVLFILILSLIGLFTSYLKSKKWIVIFLLFPYPIIGYCLLAGGCFNLLAVETSQWGGLILNLIIAGVGMVTSLPLGILLALGRRSTMPVIKWFCIVFIECWRGVPLITVLFMASVMLPLFLPQGVNFDKLLRALIGITLFEAAYMAEVIRGGLQSIHNGQYEASMTLGLGYWQMMRLVILPQAIRIVIPGIVNTLISLFKDTALIVTIGLFDLLAIIQAAVNNQSWLGYAFEGYVFAGFVFWFFCFTLSRYSQYIEKHLRQR